MKLKSQFDIGSPQRKPTVGNKQEFNSYTEKRGGQKMDAMNRTKLANLPKVLAAIVLASFVFSLGQRSDGQLVDGDFDELPVGTAPDDDAPAGAWFIPQNYIDDEVSEGSAIGSFSIVATSSFDNIGFGNSFAMIADDLTVECHIPNLLDSEVTTEMVFRIETFAPTGGGAGTFYLGGDHGGGGHATIDRGPQISFLPDGTIVAASPQGDPLSVGNFKFDQWLRIELHISLLDDQFDIYAGPRDGELGLIGEDLDFRAGSLEHVDRVTFVYFGEVPFLGAAHQYFDNLELIVLGDVNQDGDHNLLDVAPFVDLITNGVYQVEADVNQDGEVNLLDVGRFVELLVF